MKKYAQTGISYIRSISEIYHIDPEFFQNMTSISMFRKVRFQKTAKYTGITMATAILSG